MTRSKFYSLLSTSLGFIGGLWLVVGTLLMSQKEIEELSGTYLDSNPHLYTFFIATKVDSIIGAILITFAFLMQFVIAYFDDSRVMMSSIRVRPFRTLMFSVACFVLIALVIRYFLVK